MKKYKLSVLTHDGSVVDTTIIEAKDRIEALKNSRILCRMQGINNKISLRLLRCSDES